jgi:endonuclease-8
MPEGPSIIILKEAVQPFKGQIINDASGNAGVDIASFKGQKIRDIRSWGKQFFICLEKTTICIHFLLFGSYSINEQTKPDKSLRLGLHFSNGALYFYSCSVRVIRGELDAIYDWKADVMSDIWDPSRAREKLKALPDTMVCDVLLDQEIFSGVGNIIKNEVLYRIMLHPETITGNIPSKKITALIMEARNYSFDFLNWKKAFELKKHWLAHNRKICFRCNLPFIKKYCGKTHRRSFFCENCQVKYD